MDIITFDKNLFSPLMVKGTIECPDKILDKMINTVVSAMPSDASVTKYDNSAAITLNGKRIDVSVWKFNLSDITDCEPLNQLKDVGYNVVIVWDVKFDSPISVHKNADITCAAGYNIDEQNRVMFMLGTKVMQYIRPMQYSIKEFFSDDDPMVAALMKVLPAGSVKSYDSISLSAEVPVNDYIVNVSYRAGNLRAVIPHKYTETDYMYGAHYANYCKSVQFATPDYIATYNWDALWNDLYENRNGTCTYRGSLGS